MTGYARRRLEICVHDIERVTNYVSNLISIDAHTSPGFRAMQAFTTKIFQAASLASKRTGSAADDNIACEGWPFPLGYVQGNRPRSTSTGSVCSLTFGTSTAEGSEDGSLKPRQHRPRGLRTGPVVHSSTYSATKGAN